MSCNVMFACLRVCMYVCMYVRDGMYVMFVMYVCMYVCM